MRKTSPGRKHATASSTMAARVHADRDRAPRLGAAPSIVIERSDAADRLSRERGDVLQAAARRTAGSRADPESWRAVAAASPRPPRRGECGRSAAPRRSPIGALALAFHSSRSGGLTTTGAAVSKSPKRSRAVHSPRRSHGAIPRRATPRRMTFRRVGSRGLAGEEPVMDMAPVVRAGVRRIDAGASRTASIACSTCSTFGQPESRRRLSAPGRTNGHRRIALAWAHGAQDVDARDGRAIVVGGPADVGEDRARREAEDAAATIEDLLSRGVGRSGSNARSASPARSARRG